MKKNANMKVNKKYSKASLLDLVLMCVDTVDVYILLTLCEDNLK